MKVFATFIILFFAAVTGSALQAQQISFKHSSEWVYLYTIDGVNFYYSVQEHKDSETGTIREYVVLKIQNTNDKEVNVKWNQIIYYNNKCFNCGNDFNEEYIRRITIAGNSSLEGSAGGDKTLKIFSRFIGKDSPQKILTDFRLEKIEVK